MPTVEELANALIAVVELIRTQARAEDHHTAPKLAAEQRLWAITKYLSSRFEPGSFAAQLLDFAGSADSPVLNSMAKRPNHLRVVGS